MWRWLHSLPRVVRQQCSGSGASAGIHVDEYSDLKDKKQSQNSCQWKSHCKQSHDESDGKHGSRPGTHDFWRMVHGPHTAIDAIGLGSVVALGIQMGHFTCLHQRHKDPDLARKHCLLSTIVLHALPTAAGGNLPSTSRNIVHRHDSSHSRHSTGNQRLATVNEHEENAEHTKEAANKDEKCESVEEAFKNFQDVCQTYTATGKGIMGTQEAQQGNLKSAVALWEEASKLGNTKSKFNLAVCYETGRGVKKDLGEALRLYTQAAEDLHPQAMYNLGQMFVEGSLHTPRDPHKGLQLISAAADFGLAEAQCYMGIYFMEERTENLTKAIHYLNLASNQQNSEAQYFLGLCYQHGYGVEENLCKAADLFSKSAESGHPDSTYSLAVFHLNGIGGLPQDKHCGERLMKKAAGSGCQDAIKEIQKKKKSVKKLSTVIQESSDYNSRNPQERKNSSNLTYQLKLNNSVSSPCLTDLLRENMIPLNKDLVCDPVSDTGTLSQLYTQLMVPRGFTMTPSITKIPESRSPSPTERDSDSGVVFKLGLHSEEEEWDSIRTRGFASGDSVATCSLLHRRTSTMPDLNVITCL